MLPPLGRLSNAAESIPAKALHSSLNKVKHPINVVRWTPEGRRLLTGSTSGEFTLWNGMGFNFETIMQVRDNGEFYGGPLVTYGRRMMPQFELRYTLTVTTG
jgi:polyadenylation factor subunit 2